jgi:hypothetical protein
MVDCGCSASFGATAVYGAHHGLLSGQPCRCHVSKILEGYQRNGQDPRSGLKLVSMYVEQSHPHDISQAMAELYGVRLCKTIDEAITLGSDKVQVAGVLSIAARGDYPLTPETQQKMYPRREFFDETVAAFKRCIIGSTDAKGVEVTDRKVDHRHLFHTYLQASESTRRASLMLLVENSQLPIRLLDRSQPRMFFIWQRLLATSLTAIFIPTRSTSTRLTTMDMFDPCDWPPRDRDNFSFFMR